jgi:phosphomannomutase
VTLDPSVFKAYDIRGLYPEEIDEEGGRRAGAAFVAVTGAKRIALGHDVRLSSPSMAEAVAEGALAAGADVVELGLCATEMLYFAVADGGLDAGACVTASHNPPQYTGLKMVREGALPLSGDSGIAEVGRIAADGPPEAGAPGSRARDEGLLGRYVDRCMSFVDPAAVRDLRVVLDAANGMAGLFLPPALERLSIDAVPFFLDLDGTFPNHEPNPLLPENREFVIGKVREEGADLGIAFDGDADRCFFVDDTGEFVPGDFVTALLAESMLEKEPGGTIIYDVRASWAVRHVVERLGGTALPNRVGHAFIKLRMREVDAVFAGEVSGHYYFRDFYQADSGTIPALLLLELVSKRGQKLSELLRPFRERYFLTGELNTPVADVALTLQRLKEHFAGQGEVSHLDGVSITAEDWHLNVRPSNTEPLLRLNLEALDPELLERKRDEALAVIAS